MPAIPRGTAVFDQHVVYGYPHISRIAALRTGLQHQLQAPLWLEEKINGYNVRITRLGDHVLALTRGGYVCPFTTGRLPDLLDTDLFDHHPDLVLCAEVAGPGTPYLESHPPFITHDIALFIFDIMHRNQTQFVTQEEKHRLIDRFLLPSVNRFGRFTHRDAKAIAGIVLELNAQQREGVTFKENPGNG